jgi:hypothetical protein
MSDLLDGVFRGKDGLDVSTKELAFGAGVLIVVSIGNGEFLIVDFVAASASNDVGILDCVRVESSTFTFWTGLFTESV